MPQINWNDETALAVAADLTCRVRDYPGEETAAPTPRSSNELRFNKITQDGQRYLDIAAIIGGRPAHFVLDRDDIEKLRAFLGGIDGR